MTTVDDALRPYVKLFVVEEMQSRIFVKNINKFATASIVCEEMQLEILLNIKDNQACNEKMVQPIFTPFINYLTVISIGYFLTCNSLLVRKK